jgi:hypothetical protein
LEKTIFRTFLGVTAVSHVNEIMQFFAHHPIFSSLPTSDIVQLAGKATISKFPIDFIFVKEGETRSEVFFLKEGMVQLVRKVKFKGKSVDAFLGSQTQPDMDDPTKEDIATSNYFEILMDLDSLEKGATINDFSILHGVPSNYTAVSTLPTTMISLEYDIISRVLSQIHLDRYIRTLKGYPTDDELRYLYYFKHRWAHYKNKYIKHLNYNKMSDR